MVTFLTPDSRQGIFWLGRKGMTIDMGGVCYYLNREEKMKKGGFFFLIFLLFFSSVSNSSIWLPCNYAIRIRQPHPRCNAYNEFCLLTYDLPYKCFDQLAWVQCQGKDGQWHDVYMVDYQRCYGPAQGGKK